MLKAFVIAVAALAAGCATKPRFNANSSQPAGESHGVAEDHDVSPEAKSVLVSRSDSAQAGVTLPAWAPDQAETWASDELSVQPSKSPFRLLRLIEEKDPPFRQW